MQESRFSSPNGNLTSLTFRSFPYNWCEVSPSWFVFLLTAKVSIREIVGRFEGRLCMMAKSEVTDDSASEAFKIQSPSPALTLKNVGMLSRCISRATVALASQVCLWMSAAHARWNFSSFEPKPHFLKICFGRDRVWAESRWYWDWAELWCYRHSLRPGLWQPNHKLLWLIFTLWHADADRCRYRKEAGHLDMGESC